MFRPSDGGQRAALVCAEVGVPHVHDEHEARARAVVPHFVFEAIVEYERLSYLPLSGKYIKIILIFKPCIGYSFYYSFSLLLN